MDGLISVNCKQQALRVTCFAALINHKYKEGHLRWELKWGNSHCCCEWVCSVWPERHQTCPTAPWYTQKIAKDVIMKLHYVLTLFKQQEISCSQWVAKSQVLFKYFTDCILSCCGGGVTLPELHPTSSKRSSLDISLHISWDHHPIWPTEASKRERVHMEQIHVKNNLKNRLCIYQPTLVLYESLFCLRFLGRLSVCLYPIELLEQRSISSDAYREQSAAFSTPLWPIIG